MSIVKDIYDIGKDVGEGASKKIEESRRKAEPLTDPPPRVKENFRFREQLVEDLRRKIVEAEKTEDNKFLLSGFGGVGKTTVARALYHRLKDQCKQIGWVECWENGDLRASLLAAIDTGAQEKTDDNERFRQIKRLLRSATGETVLFLDNVDQPDPLLDQLTGYDITLVVTSRMERVEGYRFVPIPQLSEEQCVSLFRAYCERTLSEQDAPVVWELVRLVSCHTLSVELLAKGVPAGMGLAAYRDKLQTEGFGFPGLTFRTGHDRAARTVVEHLKKLFDLAKLDEEQTRVMQNLALMVDSRTLPFEVRNWIGCGENTLAALVRTGWLTQTGEGYEVHPIVREIVLLDPVPVEVVAQFLDFVAFKNYFQDGENYRAVQFKLGIVDAVLKKIESELENNWATGALYTHLGNIYAGQWEYSQAEGCYQKALDIALKVLGKNHLDTAASYNNLGNVYDNEGQYVQAEDCNKKALDIYRRVQGEEHPDTAVSYNNLGLVYEDQGKYDQAEECYKKALDIQVKVLGEDHPDTTRSYSNLSAVYDNQKRYSEATILDQKVLEIRLKVYGKEHSETANSYHSLGADYANQGKYAQAEDCYQKALDIQRKVLGEDHPRTAASYNSLGASYGEEGRYTEAVEQLLKAWKIWKQTLGPEHRYTQMAKNNLRGCFLLTHYKGLHRIIYTIFPRTKRIDQDFDTWLNNQ